MSTSADLTVVKVTAATGTQAQVADVATNDLGQTWRDVARPDTGEVSTTTTATPRRSRPQDHLPAAVASGSSIQLQITTASALDNCNASASRPVTSFVIHFEGDAISRVTLDHAIETACQFVYDSGIVG